MNSQMEIVGEMVDELRRQRQSGASVSQMVEQLRQSGIELTDVNKYFREAFAIDGRANVAMMPKDEKGRLLADMAEQYVGAQIDARREQWMNAPPYPDLMRRRDRDAFKAVARATGNVLIVCAANRSAAQHIGKPGYRCAPEPLLAVTRTSAPNQGLLSADPNSPELNALLNALRPAKTRDQYVQQLEKQGFRIAGADEGYIIRDATGAALFRGYQMHGAYRQSDGVNAWTGNEGEKIRADLNRKMGAELIRSGPHDQWAQRLELGDDHPFKGPMPPVLFFLPDGSVEVRANAKSMELFYRFLKIDWDQLYPGAA